MATETKRTIKVAVYLTVEVDVDEYILNFGDQFDSEIRESVRLDVQSAAQQSLHSGIKSVELKS